MTLPATISRQRARWFKAIAMVLPLVALLLLEGVLRLVGYGQDYPLFVASEVKSGYWVMNPRVSEKYFTQEANATVGYQELFPMEKGANTVRLFVLGASTAVGYPYLHNGSFHRWLQYRLNRTFPDKTIEVINLALTAVNSYTVRDFARQLVAYQPDAVLIYAGHNEYYGAMGVGSTSAAGSSPRLVRWVLYLREYRVVQWLTNVMSSFRPPLSEKDVQENLMKRMAAEQEIPYQSELYWRGIRQYEANMTDALAFLDEHRIPTFISTLVSNEKDLPPFISDTTQQETSAIHFYRLGHQAYAQGDFTKAKQRYIQAKELDLLRFRAPEAMNTIIRKLADRFAHVHLVDAQARVAAYAPHGIVGQETLLEHVHPNLLGYSLLADAFYQRLQEENMISNRWDNALHWPAIQRAMPITEVDSLQGAYEVMMLKEGWPFYQPITHIDTTNRSLPQAIAGALAVKQLSWKAAMDQLFRHYIKEKDYINALKVAESLVLEYPYNQAFYQQAGKLCANLDNHEQAVFYLEKAFALHKDFDTAKSLFIMLLKMDRPKQALPYLKYAASVQGKFNELKAFVTQVITLKDAYAKDTTNVQVINRIAATYLKFANTDAAAKYVDKSLQIDAHNEGAIELRKRIVKEK